MTNTKTGVPKGRGSTLDVPLMQDFVINRIDDDDDDDDDGDDDDGGGGDGDDDEQGGWG